MMFIPLVKIRGYVQDANRIDEKKRHLIHSHEPVLSHGGWHLFFAFFFKKQLRSMVFLSLSSQIKFLS